MSRALRSEMPSRASSSSRQNVPSTSTRSLAAKPGEHVVVQPREPGHVGDHAAARAVAEDEPGGLESVPSSSAARRRPPRTTRPPGSTRRAVALAPVRASATRRRSSARSIAQHGIPVAQRALDARLAVDAQRRRRLAQQQQARRVVDLGVRQQHAGDRRSADAVAPRVERLELLTQVGRGVDEKPRPVGPADRERRLRARHGPDACAGGLADLAVAVPLREAAAGGRAENANAHVAAGAARGHGAIQRLPVEHVGRDLGAQLDDLKLRLNPRHRCLQSGE